MENIEDATMNTVEEIRNLLEKDTNELLAIIGAEVGQRGFGLGDHDDESKGSDWLDENLEELKSRVCGSRLAALAKDPNGGWDKVILAAGIADLISGICTGVSPATVAALLLKMGLTSICGEAHPKE